MQLLIKSASADFNKSKVSINYPGITITKTHVFDNAKYLSVDIVIAATAKPGKVPIILNDNGSKQIVEWELMPRRQGLGTTYAQGVNSTDFVYFVMPDRFSNGDERNDKIAGMRDQSLNRDSM